MADSTFLPDEPLRKFMRQQAKRFTFKGLCTLCYETIAHVQKFCNGCDFEYCSMKCLMEDWCVHMKYCRRSFPIRKEQMTCDGFPRDLGSPQAPTRNTTFSPGPREFSPDPVRELLRRLSPSPSLRHANIEEPESREEALRVVRRVLQF
ncbi:hypothetical protein BsWGS_03843 [Bradybaena similaris]